MLERRVDAVSKAVSDNYPIYSGMKADVRPTVAVAEMYADMPLPKQRGKFMYDMAAVDNYTKAAERVAAEVGARKAVTKKLAEACS